MAKAISKKGIFFILLMFLLAYPASIFAQDNDAPDIAGTDIEEIIVTGTRASLRDALSIKRNVVNVVDVIAAEDIGKFPDPNVADSLQRITGVTIERERGDASIANIRGLPGRYTRVLLNGRSVTSTVSGDGVNRNFRFNALPSEFVSRIEVYKAPFARIQEGGIGGTINVTTHRAFNKNKRILTLNLKGDYDTNNPTIEPNITVLYSNVFLENRLGITLGGNYLIQTRQTHEFQYQPHTTAFYEGTVNGETVSAHVPQSIRSEVVENENSRMAGIFNIEWRPTDTFSLMAEVLRADFDVSGARKSLTFQMHNQECDDDPDDDTNAAVRCSSSDTDIIRNPIIANRGSRQYLIGFDATAPPGVIKSKYQERVGYMDIYTLEMTFNNGAEWDGKFGLSHARSANKRNGLEYKADPRLDSNGVGVGLLNFSFDAREPKLLLDSPADRAKLLDPENYVNNELDGEFARRIYSDSLDFTFDFNHLIERGWWQNAEFGGAFVKNQLQNSGGVLGLSSGQLETLLGTSAPLLTEVGAKRGKFLEDVGDNLIEKWVAPNIEGLLDRYSGKELIAAGDFKTPLASIIDVKEHSHAVYGQMNFNNPSGRIAGNFGFRFAETTHDISGVAVIPSLGFTEGGSGNRMKPMSTLVGTDDLSTLGGKPVIEKSNDNIGDTYTQFLPSFNMRWEPWDNHIFRFGAAKTMARPELDNFSLGLTGGNLPKNERNFLRGSQRLTLTVGNPFLAAEVSKNMDIGYEWYITKETAFAVAGFYRKFDNFIEGARVNSTAPVYAVDFDSDAEGGIGYYRANADGTPVVMGTGNIQTRQPLNRGRLEMKGFEVAVQSPLSFLPGILSNLGMTANYTYVESSRNDLTGRSRDSYNWRIYYDTRKLDVRLSYTFRDTYTTRLASTDGIVPRVAVNKRSYITVGITYRVRKGVRLLIRASNVDESLTGVPDWRIYQGLDGAYNRVIDFGSRYSVGLKINL